ncbi:MAG: chemotaxis protein CheR [Treponema sp.]|jgi:chemotaxis methyl-accepting protein methylase|nr:chemotaxis protein CheR [Treponema sp.]
MKLEGMGADPFMQHLSDYVEHIVGIKVTNPALEKLRDHLSRTEAQPDAWERIFSSPGAVFELAGLLTVNETYFFRESAHFSLLLREFLPIFSALGRPVRICSAATSIGCEAYSIAMVVDYYNRTAVAPVSGTLEAFDLSQEMIRVAQAGRYNGNAFREDGAQWRAVLDRYVSPSADTFIVDPDLREKVSFYPYNIMDGLPAGAYDLIFFRNAFIYFTPESRIGVLDTLAKALSPGGFLVMGISETAAVEHPLLANCYQENAFYFQKQAVLVEKIAVPSGTKQPTPEPEPQRRKIALTIEPERIAELIADEEDPWPMAETILALLHTETPSADMGNTLITTVIALMSREDFSRADAVLSCIERYDTSAYTHFLRGEYFYHNNRFKDAEYYYKASIHEDTAFWPAFYRVSALRAKENKVRYAYHIKQAIESINRGKDRCYEAFIGGFSPDYYRRTLEKKLTKLDE